MRGPVALFLAVVHHHLSCFRLYLQLGFYFGKETCNLVSDWKGGCSLWPSIPFAFFISKPNDFMHSHKCHSHFEKYHNNNMITLIYVQVSKCPSEFKMKTAFKKIKILFRQKFLKYPPLPSPCNALR